MLNYISAEWYKLRRTKGIFVAFGVLLLLIAVLFIPSAWVMIPSLEVYAGTYIVALLLGFFLAPIFAVRAFDDQYGRQTMKNEVVFRIPRCRIYLGKLIFGGLLGTGAAFLVLGFYLVMCILSGGMAEENALLYMDLCVRGTLQVLPLWLASLSLAFLLQVAVRNSGGAVAVNYLLLLFGTPIAVMSSTGEAAGSHFLNFMTRWFFVAPYWNFYNTMGIGGSGFSGMVGSWLVGLGWVLATTLIGLGILSRREIN
ncbi:MAG: ABC transporter permease subunit [Oscillospiraceae bacterium]|jgi:ABC-2 type transport system permease protein|nr:ABC transporter permease subunit [Oscillospiraceae bacterium]